MCFFKLSVSKRFSISIKQYILCILPCSVSLMFTTLLKNQVECILKNRVECISGTRDTLEFLDSCNSCRSSACRSSRATLAPVSDNALQTLAAKT